MIFVLINSVLVLSTRHKIIIRVRHTNIRVVIGMLHDLDLLGLDLLAIFLNKKAFNCRNLSHELAAFQTLKIFRCLKQHNLATHQPLKSLNLSALVMPNPNHLRVHHLR